MIDITCKKNTHRSAIAEATIFAKGSTIKKIRHNKIPKGDVFVVARVAGLMAVKNTVNLIPMCHPIKITAISFDYKINESSIKVECCVKGIDKTGFEMEALTGASIYALTIYDMCKMFDKEMIINDIKLVKKTGGKSDTYIRKKK
ncbi:MAG: cyclic pyranopterin monophosphate synthase MoaC [Candidatus Omnitrophota bacterium]